MRKYKYYFALQLVRGDVGRPKIYEVLETFRINIFPWEAFRGGYDARECIFYDNLIRI